MKCGGIPPFVLEGLSPTQSRNPSSSCFRRLRTHLLHKLSHFGDVTGRALVHPDLKALRGLFQMRKELLIGPLFSSFRERWLDPLPDAEEFTAGFEEQVLV